MSLLMQGLDAHNNGTVTCETDLLFGSVHHLLQPTFKQATLLER